MLSRKLLILCSVLSLIVFLLFYRYQPQAPLLSNAQIAVIKEAQVKAQKTQQAHSNSTLNTPHKNKHQIESESYQDKSCQESSTIDEHQYALQLTEELNSYRNSSLPQQQLVYALFSIPEQEETRLARLLAYHQKYPNNAMVLMEVLNECSVEVSQPLCSNELIAQAIEVNHNNGAAWLLTAIYYIEKQNEQAAINAINEISKSSFFSEYYGARINLFVQALETSSQNSLPYNFISALGFEAARASGFSKVAAWCDPNEADILRAESCLELGHNMAERSKVMFNQVMGYALQRKIYKAQGNLELDLRIKNEIAKITDRAASEALYEASVIAEKNEKILRDWLDNIERLGEIDAAKTLLVEVEHYKNSDEYIQCQ